MEDYFARQNLVLDSETGEKIRTAKILVVGAGAGGNELLKNLALMGFGHFTIIDYDAVEISNLSRTTLFSKEDVGKSKSSAAAAALNKLCLHESPTISFVNEKVQEVGKQVFLENDIVVSCVDTNNGRAYLSDWSVRLRKPFFEMGFDRFVVQIGFFPNQNVNDACLREIIGFGDFSGRRQSCSRLKISDTELQHIPTIQVSSALAGALIATEIILFLQGRSQLGNKMLQYSAEYHRCSVFDVPRSDQCPRHQENELWFVESDLDSSARIRELLEHTQKLVGEEVFLRLDDEFIDSMDCEGCRKKLQIGRFMSGVYDKERWCENCLNDGKYEEIPISANWESFLELNLRNRKHAAHLDRRLSELFVRTKDLIRVDALQDTKKTYLVKIR